jgi:hypothetical protein
MPAGADSSAAGATGSLAVAAAGDPAGDDAAGDDADIDGRRCASPDEGAPGGLHAAPSTTTRGLTIHRIA